MTAGLHSCQYVGMRTEEEARKRVEVAYHHYQRSYLTRTEMRQVSETTWGKPTLICQVVRRQYAEWTGTTDPKYHRLPLELFEIPPVHQAKDVEFLTRTGISPITGAEEPSHKTESEIQARILQNLDAIELGLTLEPKRILERKGSGRKHSELDILCRDRNGTYVVVELKRRDVKPRQIIGQIIEYMGRVKLMTPEGQAVRGYVIVGQVWPEIRYAQAVVPNLGVKTLGEVLKG